MALGRKSDRQPRHDVRSLAPTHQCIKVLAPIAPLCPALRLDRQVCPAEDLQRGAGDSGGVVGGEEEDGLGDVAGPELFGQGLGVGASPSSFLFSTVPGQTALTAMLWARNSRARLWVRPIRPNLAADWAATLASPRMPWMEDTLTMRPRRRSTMPGSTARQKAAAPVEVGRDDAVPVLGRELEEGPPDEDAGVVDEDVDGPELAFDATDAFLREAPRGDVAGNGEAAAAGGGDAARRLLELGGRARDERDAGALLGEAQRDGAADAAAGAGDEHGAVLKLHLESTFPSSLEELVGEEAVRVRAGERRPGQERARRPSSGAGRSMRTRSTAAERAGARGRQPQTRPRPARAWTDALMWRCRYRSVAVPRRTRLNSVRLPARTATESSSGELARTSASVRSATRGKPSGSVVNSGRTRRRRRRNPSPASATDGAPGASVRDPPRRKCSGVGPMIPPVKAPERFARAGFARSPGLAGGGGRLRRDARRFLRKGRDGLDAEGRPVPRHPAALVRVVARPALSGSLLSPRRLRRRPHARAAGRRGGRARADAGREACRSF